MKQFTWIVLGIVVNLMVYGQGEGNLTRDAYISTFSELAMKDEVVRQRAQAFIRRFLEAGEVERLRDLGDVHQDSQVRQALSRLLAEFPTDTEQS